MSITGTNFGQSINNQKNLAGKGYNQNQLSFGRLILEPSQDKFIKNLNNTFKKEMTDEARYGAMSVIKNSLPGLEKLAEDVDIRLVYHNTRLHLTQQDHLGFYVDCDPIYAFKMYFSKATKEPKNILGKTVSVAKHKMSPGISYYNRNIYVSDHCRRVGLRNLDKRFTVKKFLDEVESAKKQYLKDVKEAEARQKEAEAYENAIDETISSMKKK